MNKQVGLVALALLTIGAAAFFRDSSTIDAGPGGPLQDFTVDTDTCWGTAPLSGPACAGGTNTTTTTGTSTSYATAVTAYSSRRARQVTYSPAVFASAVPADGTNVGDVTARVDSGCNGGADGANDIVADDVGAAGTLAAWPAGWTGEELLHESTPPAYLDDIKPFPASFSAVSVEMASLEQIWLNGTTALSITATLGQRTPLAVVTENSSYNPSLNVSYVQMRGQPSAPTAILCFDSPGDTSMRLTTETAPADGLYARWTVSTAALDLRTRNEIATLVDLHCVTVGAAIPDGDGVLAGRHGR